MEKTLFSLHKEKKHIISHRILIQNFSNTVKYRSGEHQVVKPIKNLQNICEVVTVIYIYAIMAKSLEQKKKSLRNGLWNCGVVELPPSPHVHLIGPVVPHRPAI